MIKGAVVDKAHLRKIYREKREKIGEKRRSAAKESALSDLLPRTEGHRYLLSYSSFASEFCTKEINSLLAQEGRLALPKVVGKELRFYLVSDLNRQLAVSRWGIAEPIPELVEEVKMSAITLLFIPAICYDERNHRIGYGGGYYDRFLATLPNTAETIGIGYLEQQSDIPIPTEESDILLSRVSLY